MNIAFGKPPCWDEANAFFKLDELKMGTVMTYGSTLFNPYGVDISQDLLAHEETHGHQQEHNDTVAKLWWQRYIAEQEFRLSQEAEAYAQQYKFLCKNYKDRNKRATLLWNLAKALSGPMYGSIIEHGAAMKKIRELSV